MRFGLQTGSAGDVAGVARAAEDVGYASLQVADHLGSPDPLVALGAAATVTTRLRLGTFVLNNEFWPVALTARAAATLDVVSGGRLELGLGAGHMRSEFDAAGWTFHSGGQRVTHLGQDARMLRRLLDGETVTEAGDRTTLHQLRLEPAPVQQHVPILIGGNGDRVLRLAAELADIVSLVGFRHRPGSDDVDLSHFSRDGLADRLAVVRGAAGARRDDVEINLLIQHVEFADTPEAAAARAATGWAGGELTPQQVLDSPFVLTGSVSSVCEDLHRLHEDTGASYFTVREVPGGVFDAVLARLADA